MKTVKNIRKILSSVLIVVLLLNYNTTAFAGDVYVLGESNTRASGTSTTLYDGYQFNSQIKSLYGDYTCYDSDNNITKIVRVDTPWENYTDYSTVASGSYPVYMRDVDDEDSQHKIIELYTEADTIKFNSDCFGMFMGFRSLNSINLGVIDTSDVTDMSHMFDSCISLTSLDLSEYSTNKVTTFECMFDGCTALSDLDISTFITNNVVSMNYMFRDCNSLETLNLSSFELSSSVELTDVLEDAKNLTKLKAPKTIPSGKILKLPVNGRFWRLDDNTPYGTPDDDTFYYKCINDVWSNYHTYIRDAIPSSGDGTETTLVTGKRFNAIVGSITDPSFSHSEYNIYSLFSSLSSLTVVNTFWDLDADEEYEIANIAASGEIPVYLKVTHNGSRYDGEIYTIADTIYCNPDSSYMFYQFSYLEEVDMRKFNTSKVTNMSHMFKSCGSSCENPIVYHLENMNTGLVTDMSFMFEDCNNVTTFDLSHFNTTNVTTMESMFHLNYEDEEYNVHSKLITLDLSSFNTSQVTNMSSMFDNQVSLTSLNVSSFDVANVTDMSFMFHGCEKLTILNLNNFITDNVTNLNGMFASCSKLVTLNVSNFVTLNLENARDMFADCSSLKSLDLSGWHYNAGYGVGVYGYGVYTENMFSGCDSLEYLNLKNFEVYGDDSYVIDLIQNLTSLKKFVAPDIMGHYCNNVDTSINLPEVEGLSWYLDDKAPFNVADTNKTYTKAIGNTKVSHTYIRSDYDGFSLPTMTMLKAGKDFNLILKQVADPDKHYADGYTNYAPGNHIIWVDTPFDDSEEGVVKVSLDTETIPVYVRLNKDNDYTLELYSSASIVYCNPDSSYMFYNFKYLDELDTSRLDTSKVTNMSKMFAYLEELPSIDVSNFDLSSAEDVSEAFSYCYNLSTITGIESLDVSNIVNFEGLFWLCGNLTILNLTSWDVSKAEDISKIFSDCAGLTSLDVHTWDVSNVSNFSNVFCNCDKLVSLDVKDWNVSKGTNFASIFSSCESLNSLDVSKWNVSNGTNFTMMFSSSTSLEELDLSSWNVSNGTVFDMMFDGAKSLKSVGDISNWDVSKCGNFFAMFRDTAFETLNLSNWKLPTFSSYTQVLSNGSSREAPTTMYDMFLRCKNLKNLDVSNWDTSNIVIFSEVFQSCESLESLNLSSWNLESATNLQNMFYSCKKLKEIKGLNTWDVSNVTSFQSSFYETAFEEIDISNWVIKSGAAMYLVFSEMSNLKKIRAPKTIPSGIYFVPPYISDRGADQYPWYLDDEIPYDVADNDTVYKSGGNPLIVGVEDKSHTYIREDVINLSTTLLPGTEFNALIKQMVKAGSDSSTEDKNILHIKYVTTPFTSDVNVAEYGKIPVYAKAIEEASFYTIWLHSTAETIYANPDSSYMFNGFDLLQGTLDVSWMNTSKCTSMKNFFSYTNMTGINFGSAFITDNVTDMSGMFEESSLTSLNLPQTFNTSKVTDMSNMFKHISSMKELTLSDGFDTSAVTNMSGMFYDVQSLTSLDVSDFDTSNVTDMSDMFNYSYRLETLDLSNFNTSKVTDMHNMFYMCYKLNTLNISSFDTSNVTNMSRMFSDCTNLTNFSISSFNTAKVTSMSLMFTRCLKLKNIDISNFVIGDKGVTNISSMFYDCYRLESVTLPESLTHLDGWMFNDNIALNTIYGGKNIKRIDDYAFYTSYTNLDKVLNNLASQNYADITGIDTTKPSMYKILQFPDYADFKSACWIYHDWHKDYRSVGIYTVSAPVTVNGNSNFSVSVNQYIGVDTIDVEGDKAVELSNGTSNKMYLYLNSEDISTQYDSLVGKKYNLKNLAETADNITDTAVGVHTDSEGCYLSEEKYTILFKKDEDILHEMGNYQGNFNLYFSKDLTIPETGG